MVFGIFTNLVSDMADKVSSFNTFQIIRNSFSWICSEETNLNMISVQKILSLTSQFRFVKSLLSLLINPDFQLFEFQPSTDSSGLML